VPSGRAFFPLERKVKGRFTLQAKRPLYIQTSSQIATVESLREERDLAVLSTGRG